MEKYKIAALDTAQYQHWDRLVSGSITGSPFVTSYWLNAYCKASGENFEILGCYNLENELVAGFAFIKRTKFGRFNLVVNLLGIDSPLVFQSRNTNLESKRESFYFEIANLFISYLETHYNHIEFLFKAKFLDVRPFKWQQYEEEIRYTYLGAIESPEIMLASFNPDVRNKVKKAQKCPFRIDVSSTLQEINISYSLITRSLDKNSQSQVFTEKGFASFCTELAELGALTVYNIYLDNIPVATRVIVKSSEIAIDFQAGGNEEYFNTGLNQLLSYEIFKDLFAQGVKTYDFRGANTPSVAKYKAGFNFKAVPYILVQKNKGLLFNALMQAKFLLKSFYAR